MPDIKAKSLALHQKLQGKIKVSAAIKVDNDRMLAEVYTPGVGAVSQAVTDGSVNLRDVTIVGHSVAVISDGSAVLGLGNIGPAGALPVMEGKAMLFAQLAGLNAWPIVLDTQDPDEIVATIKHIAPVFGGINLEDIAAPQCFDIERRLQQELDIPVIHDDQHATAIAVLAGLINAVKVTGKQQSQLKVVIVGAGAAGNAVAKLLIAWGVADVMVVDSKGIISTNRTDLDNNKQQLAEITNKTGRSGSVSEALSGSDVVIGLSIAGLIDKDMVSSMSSEPIVFALANPTPEIMPDEAKSAGAAVIATGRSDFPNQINNVLVFPGMFKGSIGSGVRKVTIKHKLAAAEALAHCVAKPDPEHIVPSVFDSNVVEALTSVFGLPS
jgi:malate dehydrogenase (oxaloacetate-decarboxylating)